MPKCLRRLSEIVVDLMSITRVRGPNLTLRFIEPEDAEYVYGLRTDPTYNTHLTKVTGTAGDQRRWIEAYKERESKGEEFYYVIENEHGISCGLVRLYEIDAETFTWGSWILDKNKPSKAALESAVLSFGVGFEALQRTCANVDVRVENAHAAAFYRRLGMIEINRTERDIFFAYPRSRFLADKLRYLKLVCEEVT